MTTVQRIGLLLVLFGLAMPIMLTVRGEGALWPMVRAGVYLVVGAVLFLRPGNAAGEEG